MKSVKSVREPGGGLSAGAGCPSRCGMCPSCAFAPNPPGSTQCVWKGSEGFRRRFVLELLLRCTNTQVLESIHRVLGVTSWTLLTYARSRSPSPAEEPPCRGAERAQAAGRPLGMDLSGIWGWFSRSPDWIKSRYLFRLFGLCDQELLRMVANLTSVLLIRRKRGFLQFDGSSRRASAHDPDSDGDSEEPALMVVPGSLRSVSGVSRYRDFIGCLPVDLSKRILGLLGEHTLRRCQKVCRHWQHLAQETMEEIKFRRIFQDQIKSMMKRCKHVHKVSPTYANIVEVPVPVTDDENDLHCGGQNLEAARAKTKTKMVQMEERNVYCGAYFTTTLLDNEDSYRVVDYRGGLLMASGSKDRVLKLHYVASEAKAVSVMKGHVGSIRAVLLCEDRDLVITASSDASIRCWNSKTDKCVMVLYGHSGAVNCLDVHADRLVSGAKDCLVKGKNFEDFHFKHPSSVQCVRISTKTLYSSCDRGLVKMWDVENASLLRVIDAHRSSVKCLFVDEWYFLSGDSSGQVMAWRTNCDAKECLMTFNHPKEVKSLTLVYLRVVTGCADGKIRVFNFLTGDCLRDFTAEAETGRIISLHFHDNSILVNATSGVKRYQFAKVFWDYTQSAEGGQEGVSEKCAPSPRKPPFTSAGADGTALASPSHKKPEKAELLHHTCLVSTPTKCHVRTRESCTTVKQAVMLSQRATSERMKKRGLHHPLTRDSILLRVNAIQKAQCTDEVSVNMECNARLRDSWGPHVPQDPLHSDPLKESLQTQTCPLWHTHHPSSARICVPILKRAVRQNVTSTTQGRAQPHSAGPHRPASRLNGFITCAVKGPQAPECMKAGPSLPRISLVGALREQGGFRQLSSQLEQKLSDRVKKQENALWKKSHVHS